jgi:hypothetical protein
LAEQELCSSDDMRGWLKAKRAAVGLLEPSPAMAALTGVAFEKLQLMGMDGAKGAAILGVPVPSKMVTRRLMRACPSCLAEDCFHRSIWELGLLRVCPHHRRELIERCPGCGTSLRWQRSHIGFCHCDTVLSEAPFVPAVHGCDTAEAIYSVFEIATGAPDLPDEFRQLPFRDLLEVLAFLGRMDRVVASGGAATTKARCAGYDMRDLDAAVRMVRGWPRSFEDLIRRVAVVRSHLRGQFVLRPLQSFVARNAHRSYGPILMQALQDFLVCNHGAVDVSIRLKSSKPRILPSYVDNARAMEILKLSRESFKVFRKNPLWAPIQAMSEWTGDNEVFPEEPIRALEPLLSGMISSHSAGVTLGLGGFSWSSWSDIPEVGLLEVRDYDGRRTLSGRVQKSAVEALLAELERHVIDVPPKDPVSIDHVYERIRERRVTSTPMAALFRLLMAGHLRGYPAKPDERGLRRLVFERAEADAAAARSEVAKRETFIELDPPPRVRSRRKAA